MTKLVVGLGNIGLRYRNTYHNLGFEAADALAKKLHARFNRTECSAKTAVCNVRGERVVIAKPTTYMNLSGEAVAGLLGRYGCGPEDLVVIYDDVDIPLGTLRLRREGGPGTHNGMRNIVERTGHTDFRRVRIGTGFPRGERPLYDVVLSRIQGENKKPAEDAAERAACAVLEMLEGETFDVVMQKYNG